MNRRDFLKGLAALPVVMVAPAACPSPEWVGIDPAAGEDWLRLTIREVSTGQVLFDQTMTAADYFTESVGMRVGDIVEFPRPRAKRRRPK